MTLILQGQFDIIPAGTSAAIGMVYVATLHKASGLSYVRQILHNSTKDKEDERDVEQRKLNWN